MPDREAHVKINSVIVEILFRIEEKFIASLLPAKELFRKRRPVVRNVRLISDQRNRTIRIRLAELLGRLAGGEASSDEKIFRILHEKPWLIAAFSYRITDSIEKLIL